MKKKILLLVCLLLITFNVKALTFNVNLTNIEDKQSGTLGTIDNIDLDKQELDATFQSSGDEINFELTIINSGNRAGTLKSITVSSDSKLVDYTTNLPENGLAIGGGGINKVLINGKLKDGVTSGNGKSKLTIKYDYEEGSCPEGEILSEDETECLCPEGYERNDEGICVKPETNVTCADDEIYNSTKKICEKKEVIPTPKTGDNIILITLLFILAGLALYAFLFKKFKTGKARRTFGIVTAIATFSASILVLITVFGVDGLLGAVINPIQRQKEIYVTVNENVDFIEVWDGTCSLTTSELTPEKIFEGGVGTESNPYQIKTANQLACFAASINNGTTYEGKFVKQIKNIKLNENLNDQVTAGDLSNAHVWTAAGNTSMYFDDDLWDHVLVTENYFAGTYDGDNYIISGLYLTNDSNGQYTDSWNNLHHDYKGLFGVAVNATIKNLTLADVYINSVVVNPQYHYSYDSNVGALLGYGEGSITLNNIKTYGKEVAAAHSGGIVSKIDGKNVGSLVISNTENNIDIDFGTNNYSYSGGIAGVIVKYPESNDPNVTITNVTNNGSISKNGNSSQLGGLFGYIEGGNILINNALNSGTLIFSNTSGSTIAGVIGEVYKVSDITVKNSANTGDFSEPVALTESGGIIGKISQSNNVLIEDCYNSGDIKDFHVYPEANYVNMGGTNFGGVIGYQSSSTGIIRNSYNTGDLAMRGVYVGGILGQGYGTIDHCYNLGALSGANSTGGIAGAVDDISYSYNKGNIIFFGQNSVGGIVGSKAKNVTYSYNEGDITITANVRGASSLAAGIAGASSKKVENCYNRGNIISYNASRINGIAYEPQLVRNCYNSGNITYMDELGGTNTLMAGISYLGDAAVNCYNTGNLIAHQKESGTGQDFISMAGILSDGSTSNSVNTGNITLIIDSPYTSQHDIRMGGITDWGSSTNSFNAGNVSLDDSALNTPVASDGLNHKIRIGEILVSYLTNSSGNKFTNQNGVAAGCIGSNECTSEESAAVGSYTTESVPSILSIINDDDAFEIKPGETLPTLKVFNN